MIYIYIYYIWYVFVISPFSHHPQHRSIGAPTRMVPWSAWHGSRRRARHGEPWRTGQKSKEFGKNHHKSSLILYIYISHIYICWYSIFSSRKTAVKRILPHFQTQPNARSIQTQENFGQPPIGSIDFCHLRFFDTELDDGKFLTGNPYIWW
jgi:hypothetical protein